MKIKKSVLIILAGVIGLVIIFVLLRVNKKPQPESKGQLGDAANEEECQQKGGTWGKWGLAGMEYCQIPSKDFEKDCMDGSQCQYGKCIAANSEAPGKCQKFPTVFGCLSYIEDGKISSTLCID